MLEKQINLKVAIGVRLNFKLFGDGSIPFGMNVLFVCVVNQITKVEKKLKVKIEMEMECEHQKSLCSNKIRKLNSKQSNILIWKLFRRL